MVRNNRIEEPTVTGADDYGRDAAGRPPYEGADPSRPAPFDDMPTTEFSRLVFDDDGDVPFSGQVPPLPTIAPGTPPPPVRPRIPGIDGPAAPLGFRDPSSSRQTHGEPSFQRPVMPPVQPPPNRNPITSPPPMMPQQRDSNADSGPGPASRRPSREPGARERQVLREAQQFDVFRREPVAPPEEPLAPPMPPVAAMPMPVAEESFEPVEWQPGPVDISVYDQAEQAQASRIPGRDLGFPPLASVAPLSSSGVFAEYEEPQYEAYETYEAYEEPRLDPQVYEQPPFEAPQFEQIQYEQQQYEAPQFEQPQFDHSQLDQPQFDQSQFEQPPFEQPHYDESQFEQPQFEQPQYDQPQFEAPQFEEEYEPVYVSPLTLVEPEPPLMAEAPFEAAAPATSDHEPEMLVPWVSPDALDPIDGHDAIDGNDIGDASAIAEILRVPPYEAAELAAVHRVIRERRDVRSTFLGDPIPDKVLTRVLEAAHTAPSVGFSQPWDFLVLRSEDTRRTVHELAVRQRDAYAASLPKARARAFKELKIEAILDTPVNIVVTCDPTRGGRHTLGRFTQPHMAPYSSALAVENLWLAARAEGLGVGWVSFFDERELTRVLDLPEHLSVIAYLCVGYVREFPEEPELSGSGWAKRRPLAWAVHDEQYGRRALPGSEPVSLLDETLAAIAPLDDDVLAEARARQNRLTKPPGSLGVLEDVSVQLAGLAGVCPPPMPEPAAVAIFAADHGVHAQGVSPWPQEVTAQMVANFLAGGAVVNAFAAQIGAEVCVVDVGVAADLPAATGLIPRKVRYGTDDLAVGPAMTREDALTALEVGIETARDLVAAGNRCLLTGDMGIANTTASAALIAAFTGASPAQVTGYGTGIDEQTYAHKVEVVRRALDLHRPDPADPLGVLAAVGGLEHAALAGFILGAASLRTPVVLDGVIAGAAALVAQALAPDATAACVAGHRSAESGHQLALEALGIIPLIDLELRLGEGSGAVLALPLVQAAVRVLRDVATFETAGVAERPTDAD